MSLSIALVVSRQARAVGTMLLGFGPRAWLVALAATVAALVLIGVPTRLIANDWFIRMTPTRTQDYVFWIISAPLIGLIAGSYTLDNRLSDEYKVTSGGVLSYLAVGCPICNKLIVLALGVSGAMTYFAPAQIFIGMGSIVLLLWTLGLRARSIDVTCEIRPSGVEGTPLYAQAYVLQCAPKHSDEER